MYLLGVYIIPRIYFTKTWTSTRGQKQSTSTQYFEIQNNNKFKTMTQLEIEEINHLLQKVIPIDYYK